MNIRAQKISVGIEFTIQRTGKGRINPNHSIRGANKIKNKMVQQAIEMYYQEVLVVLKREGLPTEAFTRACLDARHTALGASISLEPVGFGFGTFENPEMGNMGSTPTPWRAKMLLAYQEPLNKIETAPGKFEFYKDYTV